jgi:hypothetical protein
MLGYITGGITGVFMVTNYLSDSGYIFIKNHLSTAVIIFSAIYSIQLKRTCVTVL